MRVPRRLALAGLAFALLAIAPALAQPYAFSDYNIEVSLSDGMQLHERAFLSVYSETGIQGISFSLPRHWNFYARDSMGEIGFSDSNSSVLVLMKNLAAGKPYSFEIGFDTNDFVSVSGAKHNFSFSFRPRVPVGNFSLAAIFPEGFVVPLSGQLSPNAILFPEPTRISSDSGRLVIEWKRQGLSDANEFFAIATFTSLAQGLPQEANSSGTAESPSPSSENALGPSSNDSNALAPLLTASGQASGDSTGIVIAIALIAVAGFLGGYVMHHGIYREQKAKAISVLEFLGNSEQRVISALKAGPIAQRELQDLTGFSKAKLSRLLADMESKKLVERVSMGKSNQVRLLEQK